MWRVVLLVAACGRVGFEATDDGGVATCTVGTVAAGAQMVTLCAGRALYTMPASAGERLLVRVDVGAAHVTEVVLALSSPLDTPLGAPAWTPTGVEATGLVGERGEQRISITSDVELDATVTVDITPAPGRVLHVAASGNDGGDGSESAPWQTWDTALAALEPGDTLIAHDGTWTAGSCGNLPSPCLAGATMPFAYCTGGGPPSGTAAAPITILAEHQRHAHLVADGTSAAINVDSCAFWTIDGLHARNADSTDTTGNGNTVLIRYAPNVVVRNMLIEHPNVCGNFPALETVGPSMDGLIEDNEIYDFHRHAVTMSGSSSMTARRNYVNSRSADTPSCLVDDADRTRGDVGISCYNFSGPAHCHVEDVFIEDVLEGIDDADSVEHQASGVIVRDATYGLYAGSIPATPTVRPSPLVVNDLLCLGCDVGIWNRGVQVTVDHATLVAGRPRRAVDYGVGAWADDRGGTTATFEVHDVLALDNTRAGFVLDNLASGLVRRSNGFLNGVDYEAAEAIDDTSGEIQQSLAIAPTRVGDVDGACLVYVPADSNMAGAGEAGGRIGADLVYRVVDGVTTDHKLWNQRTGQFPCGAVISGVNDIPGASCFDAHTRVRVGVGGCAIP